MRRNENEKREREREFTRRENIREKIEEAEGSEDQGEERKRVIKEFKQRLENEHGEFKVSA